MTGTPSKPKAGRGCAIAFFIIVGGLGAAAGFALCSGGTSSNVATVSDHVKIKSSGVSTTFAGTSRTNLDKFVSAEVAKDTVGAEQLVQNGEVVAVDNCSTALVIDTAIGGETQVRIVNDPGNPSNNDQALWVNTEFAQKGTPKGC
jgi:hypothetical protein